MSIRQLPPVTLIVLAIACAGPQSNEGVADTLAARDSIGSAEAVAVATQRLREHGQAGLSNDDIKRTQNWFTPELYALLLHDMSYSDGPGYLNWDPFTDAQDDVGPFRLEDVWRAIDTVMVRFSREGYQQRRDSVTLAMRQLDGSWRIANFKYSAHRLCNGDLARQLGRFAKRMAEMRPVDDTTCSN